MPRIRLPTSISKIFFEIQKDVFIKQADFWSFFFSMNTTLTDDHLLS